MTTSVHNDILSTAAVLNAFERAKLWQVARSTAATLSDECSDEVRVEAALALLSAVPTEVLAALHRLRLGRTRPDALVIGDLLPRDLLLPTTPTSLFAIEEQLDVRAAELVLLALLGMLGEPFTFSTLYGGRLVQYVVPIAGQELEQTSGGSEADLAWHVEDAFTDERCDYFALLCLRGDPGARTIFANVRELERELDARTLEILRQERFLVVPDTAHDLEPDARAMAVITGSADDPEIMFDAVYLSADHADPEALAAIDAVRRALDRSARGHILRPGELLIVDNRRNVHGRTSFAPRFDGTDRWLLRAMACSSTVKHRRRGGAHVLG